MRKVHSIMSKTKTHHGTVEPVVEGEVLDTPSIREAYGGKTATAKPSCKGDKGAWMCVTHDIVFRNQFGKDVHIGCGDHKLAWLCLKHGIEVP